MLPEKIRKIIPPQARELFAYTAGCAFSLGLKVLLAALINYAGIVFCLAYLMTHGIILFTSFFYHHCITFRKKFTTFPQACRDFADFTAMVIVLNTLDYILVVTGQQIVVKYLLPADVSDLTRQFFSSCVIIGVSGFIFVLRYFVYQVLFRKPPKEYFTGSGIKKICLLRSNEKISADNTALRLLDSMLAGKVIDGALLADCDFSTDLRGTVAVKIARTCDERLQEQEAFYSPFPELPEKLCRKLTLLQGTLAVAAPPCLLEKIEILLKNTPDAGGKTILKIGLFCGHIANFEAFQNTSPPALCMCCFDHYAEKAHVSIGKKFPALAVLRQEEGEKFWDLMFDPENVSADEKNLKDLYRSDFRSAMLHKALAARSQIFSRPDDLIPIPEKAASARWNEKAAFRLMAKFFINHPVRNTIMERISRKFWRLIIKGLSAF